MQKLPKIVCSGWEPIIYLTDQVSWRDIIYLGMRVLT